MGKTGSFWEIATGREKHPHVRGEDRDNETLAGKLIETPPRSWGRLETALKKIPTERNTPTFVGKTDVQLKTVGRNWKHPHVRGEDESDTPETPLLLETPPRSWGRLCI